MSANIEKLISRLSGVKKQGQYKWLSRCPAHQDKSPSLAIKLGPDGVILVHCFAGCSVHSVLQAISLEPTDLFPPKITKCAVKGAKDFDAYTALRAMADDVLIVLVACRMVLKGEKLAGRDFERLSLSARRLQEARSFVLGV